MWKKGKIIDDAVVIGEEGGGICKVEGDTDSSLTASTINPRELWNRILCHVNYKSLTIVSEVVTSSPEIQINHEGVCKGYAQGKNTKNPFPSCNNKAKGNSDIVHRDVCGPLSATSGGMFIMFLL